MKNFTLSKEEHINYILDHFDFQKVHNIMLHLNWTWAFSSGTPSISELKKEARRLLNEVYDTNSRWISTGGLKAIKNYDSLDLDFVATDWTSEGLNCGPEYEEKKKERIKKKELKIRKKKLEKLNEYENN